VSEPRTFFALCPEHGRYHRRSDCGMHPPCPVCGRPPSFSVPARELPEEEREARREACVAAIARSYLAEGLTAEQAELQALRRIEASLRQVLELHALAERIRARAELALLGGWADNSVPREGASP